MIHLTSALTGTDGARWQERLGDTRPRGERDILIASKHVEPSVLIQERGGCARRSESESHRGDIDGLQDFNTTYSAKLACQFCLSETPIRNGFCANHYHFREALLWNILVCTADASIRLPQSISTWLSPFCTLHPVSSVNLIIAWLNTEKTSLHPSMKSQRNLLNGEGSKYSPSAFTCFETSDFTSSTFQLATFFSFLHAISAFVLYI